MTEAPHDCRRLPIDFYEQDDVVRIARDLIGKFVFTRVAGQVTGGRITETEAYNGRNDKACHAFLRRTKRTEVMYGPGGTAYIYLCYGIHEMLNIVTNREGLADAILVRAIEPLTGTDVMEERRGGPKGFKLTSGPGNVTKALAIDRSHLGASFVRSDEIWICEGPGGPAAMEIEVDRRVGVDYAEEDALLPWRFFVRDSKWISKPKQKDATSRFRIQGPGSVDQGVER